MPVETQRVFKTAALLTLIFAAIWLPVIYLLGAQWSLFPQYQYGWAVPFLCLFLVRNTFLNRPCLSEPRRKYFALTSLILAGLVFWFMRVLQEANPLWRLASYGMTVAAMAMTLSVVYLSQGWSRTRYFSFPIFFFLIAVPWPTPIEQAIIQTLTRLNTTLVAEVLNAFNVPALVHGNVIEVSSGMVGIDEACSGIRSFQATLMISLFLGAYYQLRNARAGLLIVIGVSLALAFNFARTLVLVSIAANSGLATMERWHDSTGVLLLVGCFLSLWGSAIWFKRVRAKSDLIQLPHDESSLESFKLRPIFWAIVIWALTVEISTEIWFRSHESRDGHDYRWEARMPLENSTLKTNIISANSLRVLQCDQNASGSWTEADGTFWQAFFLRWSPADSFYGRAKIATSKFHNPARCLSAAGMKLETLLEPVSLFVRPDLSIPFNRYVFSSQGHELFVFFSQIEDMTHKVQAPSRLSHFSRFKSALTGSRNYGQNNFEFAISGVDSADAALNVLQTRLPELINTSPVAR